MGVDTASNGDGDSDVAGGGGSGENGGYGFARAQSSELVGGVPAFTAADLVKGPPMNSTGQYGMGREGTSQDGAGQYGTGHHMGRTQSQHATY